MKSLALFRIRTRVVWVAPSPLDSGRYISNRLHRLLAKTIRNRRTPEQVDVFTGYYAHITTFEVN